MSFAAGRVEGRGALLVCVQRRSLLGRRLRVGVDRDVGVAVGHPGAQRDQVILRGCLGVLQFLPAAPADGPPDQQTTQHGQYGDDSQDDQDGSQHV